MSKSLVLAFTSLAALVVAAPSAQAATMLTVGPSSTCSASGCFGETTRTFKQTFSAADGPVSISSLSLFRGIVGDMQNYAVRISFETADGTKIGSWGAYTLAMLGGEFVTLGGESFVWDAATMGDLVLKLDLLKPDKGGGFGGGGFGGFGGGASAFAPGAGVSDAARFGPPRINMPGPAAPQAVDLDVALSAAPEPGAWALMILGFGGAGVMLRRRRSAPVACG